MILDTLVNGSSYEKLNPLFKTAFDYLRDLLKTTPAPGKTELADGAVVVMVNETTLKSPEKARMEIHNEYIDIHIPLSCTERFSWKHRSRLQTESEPFNKENDAQHFEDAPETYFDVQPGDFVILFPEDAHSGCIGEGDIRKIVVKVRA